MKGHQATRADDLRLLEMLHLRDVEQWTASQIAERFDMTRSAVLGQMFRIDKVQPLDCLCRRKANRDGGMKPRWWRGKA
ncbi:hypothetical protein K7H20_23870 [Salipiger manganoxidans]|uniref:hypothetical protein n=1 Tax=Salipiger marinus TaxID=555512 RepID=UPI001E333F19|nr:hypothetical protein [Salipiger manganoxidans]MCD1621078.1 hypothetical protein [Salipiger manganoxidans]